MSRRVLWRPEDVGRATPISAPLPMGSSWPPPSEASEPRLLSYACERHDPSSNARPRQQPETSRLLNQEHCACVPHRLPRGRQSVTVRSRSGPQSRPSTQLRAARPEPPPTPPLTVHAQTCPEPIEHIETEPIAHSRDVEAPSEAAAQEAPLKYVLDGSPAHRGKGLETCGPSGNLRAGRGSPCLVVE